MYVAFSSLNHFVIFIPISNVGQQFPKDFKKRVSTLFRRFFRVYGHIYHSHIDEINKLNADAHLNTCFKHFMYFVQEFQLIDKEELQPLQPIIDSIMKRDQKAVAAANAAHSDEKA